MAFITSSYIRFHYIQFVPFHSITLNYVAFHFITKQFLPLNYVTLHFINRSTIHALSMISNTAAGLVRPFEVAKADEVAAVETKMDAGATLLLSHEHVHKRSERVRHATRLLVVAQAVASERNKQPAAMV